MKPLALATVSAFALALASPAFAMDCASKKSMQNAEAGAISTEKPAEAAAAQTPMPASDAVAATAAPQPAEVAAAPAEEAAPAKN